MKSGIWTNDDKRIVLIKGQAEDFRNATQRTAFRGTSDLIWIDANGGNNNFITYTSGRSNPHFVKGNDRIFLSGGTQRQGPHPGTNFSRAYHG